MHEKRAHPRKPVNVPVTCEVKDASAMEGIAKDLSMGGMFIESEGTPAFGTQVTIVAKLPGNATDTRLEGVVRWAKPGGFGVQFGLLGARETHAIAQFMKN